MSEASLDIAIGSSRFSGTGSEEWLEKLLDKFLLVGQQIPNALHGATPQQGGTAAAHDKADELGPLAIFLRNKSIGSNQVKRFLAAAIWLKRSGDGSLKTASVVKALADSQQQRLGNPSECLSKNVAKGFCVKQGDGFYVTPEGEDDIFKA